MSQSSSSNNISFVRELPGMLILFVVVIGSLKLAYYFEDSVMERFSLIGGSPGEEPPWYFITRDFAEGICAAGALLSCLVVAAVSRRRWPDSSNMMIWMSVLWHGGAIVQSMIIYLYCPGILDGRRVTDRWHTFDSYLYDSGIWLSQTFVMIFAILLSFAPRIRGWLSRTNDRSGTA
jgi:hypothetical protein